MQANDTIAAISTAPGEGAVGIVRLSGAGALGAALKVFASPSLSSGPEPRRVYAGAVIDQNSKERIDTGLFVFMRGPLSYTGEDVVEISCHGGPLVVKRVLEAVLRAGARLAGPGEFTRRAYLNGKLDLAQAEAVIDVIRAETDDALRSAQGRLSGALSARVAEARETLVTLLAALEAELDFPEDEVEGFSAEKAAELIKEARGVIGQLLSTYDEGRILKEGVAVVILGRPNVGKSSLLNMLLKEERAIVTDIPGTTRDVIEEVVNIRGLPMRLVDTAGLRETTDRVESIGVEAARKKAALAGLILLVVDAAAPSKEDSALLEAASGKKLIVVANKTDLASEGARQRTRAAFDGKRVEFISALTGEGADALMDAIAEEASGHGRTPAALRGEIITDARHKTALDGALEGISRALAVIDAKEPGELLATDVRYAVDRLGEITGETTTEDILERIFSTFCIGK